MHRVVVTGTGVISALGNNTSSFWQSLISGTSGIREMVNVDISQIRFKNAAQVQNYVPEEHFAAKDIDVMDRFAQFAVLAAREAIVEACFALQKAGYNFLEDVTAVDWLPASPRFQISYHILSHSLKERIRLRVMLEDASPAVETIVSVWPSANYYEREIFDLFGVRFDGHPNLRRIMMPEDWQGHPLRKDYPVEGYR